MESLIVVITLLCSAFFSGLEIAFISSNKLRIELDNKLGKISAKVLSPFVKRPSRFIGTMLVGNNIAIVIYGIVMARMLESPLRTYLPERFHSDVSILLLQTILSTLLILVAAEFIPKVLFRIRPNQTLNFFAGPILISYYLLFPFVFVVIGISEFVLKKIFQVEFSEERPVFGRIDLDYYVREFTSRRDDDQEIQNEIQIFQNALDFTKVKVRECMVPRTEIIAIEIRESMENLRQRFIATGLSRIPVYQENIDQIIGLVHSHDLFKAPVSIQSILLPVTVVPESMAAKELLTLFTQQHRAMALVVDEHGGTSGIVTMEDVMEEIFGEIEDEHDVEELTEKKLGANEFIFSGRMEVDYINQHYNLGIPISEEYKTLAGFIIHYYESIPHVKDEVLIAPFLFSILEVGDRQIRLVKMVRKKED